MASSNRLLLSFLIFSVLFCIPNYTGLKAQTYQIDTIHYSGHSEEFYDIVVLAEAYREEDMDQFNAHAHWVKETMECNNTYATLMDSINIFAIRTPSIDTGISRRITFPSPTDPIQVEDIHDTYFDIYFLNSYRAYFLDDSIVIRARQVAAEHIPFSDVSLILCNEEQTSGRASFDKVAVAARPNPAFGIFDQYVVNHELAHSIGGLADAYDTFPDEGFNKTTQKDTSRIRWKDLLSMDEVRIDSLVNGVYIPNINCMMNIADKTYLCPVCSKRITESMTNLERQLPSIHRAYFVSKDDDSYTITFGWDPIEDAIEYEVVFHAYWSQDVIVAKSISNEISFSLDSANYTMGTTGYRPSISLRAYNENASTYFHRPIVESEVYQPDATVPDVTKIEKTSETSFRIDFTKENTFATLIRLYNQNGTLIEILTANNSFEFQNLKPNGNYEFEIAAVYPDPRFVGNSSPFSDRFLLKSTGSTPTVDIVSEKMVKIYPNPAIEYLNIRMDKNLNLSAIEILDLSGKSLRSISVSSLTNKQIFISDLNSGVYFLRIQTDKERITKKFIKI